MKTAMIILSILVGIFGSGTFVSFIFFQINRTEKNNKLLRWFLRGFIVSIVLIFGVYGWYIIGM